MVAPAGPPRAADRAPTEPVRTGPAGSPKAAVGTAGVTDRGSHPQMCRAYPRYLSHVTEATREPSPMVLLPTYQWPSQW